MHLADEPSTASDFCKFVLDRVRREDAAVRISRISRVLTGGARMATYMDLFMREAGSRSSNPMLRPANPSDAASVAGLSKLKSLFERTCLGASPLQHRVCLARYARAVRGGRVPPATAPTPSEQPTAASSAQAPTSPRSWSTPHNTP